MAHRVLIIGLGAIGMGYDLEKDPKRFILSHARAFQQHAAYTLVGGVDSAPARRAAFTGQYGAPAFANIGEAIAAVEPDGVVIATPTGTHMAVFEQVMAVRRPNFILCEKPLTGHISTARRLAAVCAEAGSQLYVNYMRCSDVTTAEIHRRLADGAIGGPVRGLLWYSKGLYNSGSHFVNLAQHLLGDVTGAKLLASGENAYAPDPAPDFRLTFERGNMDFLATRTYDYFHNAMEWIVPNGRLRYERGGAATTWEGLSTATSAYAGYTSLTDTPERLPGDFERIQWHVADQMAAHLRGESARLCDGAAALRTLDVISRIEDLL